MDTCLFHL